MLLCSSRPYVYIAHTVCFYTASPDHLGLRCCQDLVPDPAGLAALLAAACYIARQQHAQLQICGCVCMSHNTRLRSELAICKTSYWCSVTCISHRLRTVTGNILVTHLNSAQAAT